MAFGHPLGSTYRFVGYQTLTAYGAGAIHVHAVNNGATCVVRMYMGNVSAVTIYGQPSVIGAALDAAKMTAKQLADEHKRALENEMPVPSK